MWRSEDVVGQASKQNAKRTTQNATVTGHMPRGATFCAAVLIAGALRCVSAQGLPSGTGGDAVRARCMACHGPELIVQQRLSRDGWAREIDKMVGWGAVVDGADRARLLDDLAANFGPGARLLPADAAADAGAMLLKTRCSACHDLRLIDQQRLDAAGWSREVDTMIGWGAVVTLPEKQTLVAHLARTRGVVLSSGP